VQSELYVALDEAYITEVEFKEAYEQARRTRAAIRGFISYLEKHRSGPPGQAAEPLNREPGTVNR
jgi:hypothetical protein